MPKRPDSRLVLVTAPDLATARRLATAALQSRTAACANLIPGVESHYWWKDALESGSEILIVFKTLESLLADLERVIHAEHPYDTPEFLVLPVHGGSRRYLDWITASVQSRDGTSRKRQRRKPGPGKSR
ncbi:MAG: divalent-cation tolerance protein CutA [Verrucomicrobiales bacterium]|nr:divalent-cation tolerance protein CutA [Verrucomicrobiales bacterium]